MIDNAPIAIVATAPAGSAERDVTIAGLPNQVFTYRPAGCRIAGLPVVFHGVTRNAEDYRTMPGRSPTAHVSLSPPG